jgi:charged multivesicular body protein 3
MFGIFKKPTPDELFRKWRSSIRSQERNLDKQIRSIDQEENKTKLAIKQVAKRNDTKSCKILAKEIIRARKHKDRLYTSKAQLNSVIMQLQHQTSLAKVAGTLQKSTDVMRLVNNLVKIPEIRDSMLAMSKEMMTAGIIEEMMDDTLESLDMEDDMEEEAEEEVNKVLHDITKGLLGSADMVNTDLDPIQLETEDSELEAMQARLSALQS